jgi:predicted transcriptional regulator
METVAQAEKPVQTSFSIPPDVWVRVRNLSTARRTPAQALWIQAMTEFLDRQPEFLANSAA